MYSNSLGGIGKSIFIACAFLITTPVVAEQTGGTLTGVTKISKIKCKNKSTGQKVTIRNPVGVSWNCEQQGLVVSAGDRISIDIETSAQGLIPDAPQISIVKARSGQVQIAWPAVDNALSYNIYMGIL